MSNSGLCYDFGMSEQINQQKFPNIAVGHPQVVAVDGQFVCKIKVSGLAWREVLQLAQASNVRDVLVDPRTDESEPITFDLILDIDSADETETMDLGWNAYYDLMKLLPYSPGVAGVYMAHKNHPDAEYFESYVYNYPPSVAKREFGITEEMLREKLQPYLEILRGEVRTLRNRHATRNRRHLSDEQVAEILQDLSDAKAELQLAEMPTVELLLLLTSIYKQAAEVETREDFEAAVSSVYQTFPEVKLLLTLLMEVVDRRWAQELGVALESYIAANAES